MYVAVSLLACLYDCVFFLFQVQPTYTFRVSFDMKTRELLNIALTKLAVTFELDQPAENFVLKVGERNTCSTLAIYHTNDGSMYEGCGVETCANEFK